MIHNLIFTAFLLRLLWGLLALMASHTAVDLPITWQLLDKNHPATALFFDLTGLMIVSGAGLAILRKVTKKAAPPGMPTQDLPALLLMGGLVFSGFLLEGIRMAMATPPPGAAYAFLGHLISRPLADMPFLDVIYGYVWYGHAVCMGLFVVYLPFSRMKHIILSPIVMLINGLRDTKRESL